MSAPSLERTKRLRIEQRKDEPPDLFALRAIAMVYPRLEDNAKVAMARWLWSLVSDDLGKRQKAP